MTDTRHPGTYLKGARERAALKQVELSRLSGISQPTICQIETGDKNLTVRVAWAVERALNLEPDSLVRWATDMPANLRSRFGAIPGYLNSLRLSVFPTARTVGALRPAAA